MYDNIWSRLFLYWIKANLFMEGRNRCEMIHIVIVPLWISNDSHRSFSSNYGAALYRLDNHWSVISLANVFHLRGFRIHLKQTCKKYALFITFQCIWFECLVFFSDCIPHIQSRSFFYEYNFSNIIMWLKVNLKYFRRVIVHNSKVSDGFYSFRRIWD